MATKKGNIEELFRQAAENYSPAGQDNWDVIAAGVRRKLFFKFFPKRLNIYYLLGIVTIAALLAFNMPFFKKGSGNAKIPSKKLPAGIHCQPNNFHIDNTEGDLHELVTKQSGNRPQKNNKAVLPNVNDKNVFIENEEIMHNDGILEEETELYVKQTEQEDPVSLIKDTLTSSKPEPIIIHETELDYQDEKIILKKR